MKAPRFILYRDVAGQWRWQLLARNGRIVASSGEWFSDRTAVRKAVKRIAKIAGNADLIEVAE